MELISSTIERRLTSVHTQQFSKNQPPPYTATMEIRRHPHPQRHVGHFGAQSADARPSSEDSRDHTWMQRVLTRMNDMLLLIGSDGRVWYASPSCQFITDLEIAQLEQQEMTRFIHEDDKAFFSAEMDECIALGRPVHCHFRFYKRDNTCCVMEAYGHPHVAPNNPAASNGNGKRSRECNGIFLVCRPYPTRSTQLLDSILEHKVENMRLSHKIAQLREEEEEEDSSGSPPSNVGQQTTHTMRSTFIASDQSSYTQSKANENAVFGDENESSDTNAEESDSRSFLERVVDRLPQPEDMSHIEGIEVMTGLYYGDGERSQGLSTGLRQGRLIQCGIDTSTTEQQVRSAQDGDRRKKLKGEYVCTDCGTADSPEWRKGPEGPKSLCNACGLRWAKKEKKRQDSSSS